LDIPYNRKTTEYYYLVEVPAYLKLNEISNNTDNSLNNIIVGSK